MGLAGSTSWLTPKDAHVRASGVKRCTRPIRRPGRGLGVAGSQDGPVDRHQKLSPPRIRQPLVLVSAGCSGLEHRPSVALSFVDERPRDQEVPSGEPVGGTPGCETRHRGEIRESLRNDAIGPDRLHGVPREPHVERGAAELLIAPRDGAFEVPTVLRQHFGEPVRRAAVSVGTCLKILNLVPICCRHLPTNRGAVAGAW